MSKRLSFLVCGAQKSGTTALAAYLRQHPGIQLPEKKELHFFDDEMQPWPEPDPGSLHSHFQGADADQLWEKQRRSASTGIQQQSGSGATTQQCV